MSKYGYTRTQTDDEQGEARQRKALIDAGVEEQTIHSDRGSGTTAAMSRAGWSALDARLQDGDELVVWSIERIGRSPADVFSTIDDLVARGVTIQSLEDGITINREHRFRLDLMAAVAEHGHGIDRV